MNTGPDHPPPHSRSSSCELALLGLAIRDLLKDERHVRGGNKALWALVIVFISLLGPIVYFAVGREDV